MKDTIKVLDPYEFKSIWEIAFRWENVEPPEGDPEILSDDIAKNIEKLIWAFRRNKVVIRHSSGDRVLKDDFFEMYFMDRTMIRLNKCLKTKVFPYSLLSQRFAQKRSWLK